MMNRAAAYFAAGAMCVWALGGMAAEPSAPGPDDYLREIGRRFAPVKPTVEMVYAVHYRFLAVSLKQVARATIEATEGEWRAPGATGGVPSCVISVRLQSPGAAAGLPRSGLLFFNDHIVSVVTMPALETLYYLKVTDELLHPLLGARKDVRNFHVYDMSGGELAFHAVNLADGTTLTNLTGATDMAAQGREVSRVLTLLSDVYHRRIGAITPDSDFRLFVNCDGRAVPFAARSARDRIEAFGGDYDALRVDVMPAREAPRGVRARDFTVWAASFLDVAGRSEDAALRRIAADTPAWGMTPLLADYGMSLGSIRCALVSVAARAEDAKLFDLAQRAAIPPAPCSL